MPVLSRLRQMLPQALVMTVVLGLAVVITILLPAPHSSPPAPTPATARSVDDVVQAAERAGISHAQLKAAAHAAGINTRQDAEYALRSSR